MNSLQVKDIIESGLDGVIVHTYTTALDESVVYVLESELMGRTTIVDVTYCVSDTFPALILVYDFHVGKSYHVTSNMTEETIHDIIESILIA